MVQWNEYMKAMAEEWKNKNKITGSIWWILFKINKMSPTGHHHKQWLRQCFFSSSQSNSRISNKCLTYVNDAHLYSLFWFYIMCVCASIWTKYIIMVDSNDLINWFNFVLFNLRKSITQLVKKKLIISR